MRRTIEESTYVDDCYRSLADVAAALRLLDQLPKMLAHGGFELGKMVSNSAAVMEKVAEGDKVSGVIEFGGKVMGEDQALGMKLDLCTDTFKPNFDKNILTRPVHSRRGVLAIVAAVWLPLGLFIPFVIPAKIIIQHLASLKLSWDDMIPEADLKRFDEWRKSLCDIESLEVTRWLQWKPGQKAQIHIFSDASARAYGAVAYLRIVDAQGVIHVTLVFAKGRIFPLNEKTSGLHGSMPKKELVATLLGVEVKKIVSAALGELDADFFCWTDSYSVHRWCYNDSLKLEVFVANRVSKILVEIPPDRLKWCSGTTNPADQISRGIRADEKERSGTQSGLLCLRIVGRKGLPQRN